MEKLQSNRIVLIMISLVLMFALILPGSGYAQFKEGQKNTVPDGQEAKIKGVILTRDGETFVVRDLSRMDTVVVLTESTIIKTERKGLGLLPSRRSKNLDVTALLPGLILQVEGKGDAQGRLVASKIQFTQEDLKAALTAFAQTSPVEDKTDKALREIAQTEKRISSLDQYDVVKVVTVNFAHNSDKLSKESKAKLDELASRAPGAKNYMVEVQGFADSTGKFKYNLQLSQRRADAVVQYLAVKHNIPLRRMTTPMGYGETKSAGETKDADRAQNRRVEVKILVNKGLNQ